MIKVPILITFFIVSFSLFAQLNKGVVSLEGQFTFVNSSFKGDDLSYYKSEKESYFSFRNHFGFFAGKNVSLGLGFSYENYELKQTENNSSGFSFKNEVDQFFISPAIHVYAPLANKLYFRSNFKFDLGFGDSEYSFDGVKLTYDISSLGFNYQPSLCYFISNSLMVTATYGQIYYSSRTEEFKEASNSFNPGSSKTVYDEFGIDFNTSTFSLGFVMMLNNKTKKE